VPFDATVGDPKGCSVVADIYQGQGICWSPLRMGGFASFVDVVQSNQPDPRKGSARIASTLDPNAETGLGILIPGRSYDLTSSASFLAYNELTQNYAEKSLWDFISIRNAFERISFAWKDKVVTMLLPAFSQPLASWAVWDECNVPSSQRVGARFDDLADLKGVTFSRGDYLFCVKNSLGETCSPSDYQWLDLETEKLVATRPSKPRVHGWLVNDKPKCILQGQGRYSVSYGAVLEFAKLDKPFRLYADMSHGSTSVQWPGAQTPFGVAAPSAQGAQGTAPFALYFFQSDDNGPRLEGTSLKATLAFDITDALFLEDMTTTALTEMPLEAVLAKVTTKAQWVFAKKAAQNVVGYGPSQFPPLSVQASVEVSGARERPTATEKDVQP
jgi:hypothetical protein